MADPTTILTISMTDEEFILAPAEGGIRMSRGDMEELIEFMHALPAILEADDGEIFQRVRVN